MIPNALQPASIEEVFLYVRLGRAVVLVKEDQLSLAIGRRGQNVRLASKLVGWDIEIMTLDELNEGIERAEGWFKQIPSVTDEMVERFIEEGFLSYDDLTFLEPVELAELAGVTEDQAQEIIDFAEDSAERVEEETRHRPGSRGRGGADAGHSTGTGPRNGAGAAADQAGRSPFDVRQPVAPSRSRPLRLRKKVRRRLGKKLRRLPRRQRPRLRKRLPLRNEAPAVPFDEAAPETVAESPPGGINRSRHRRNTARRGVLIRVPILPAPQP